MLAVRLQWLSFLWFSRPHADRHLVSRHQFFKFKIGKMSRLYLAILEEIIAVMPAQRKQGRDDQHQCGIDRMKSDAVR